MVECTKGIGMKIKQAQVKTIREQLLKEQGGLCGMCQLPLDPSQAVLDHNHKTGYIRGACHRSCNSAEGKLINAVSRFGVPDVTALLQGLSAYYTLHATNQSDLIYPSHKTPQERKLATAKRRKKARSKPHPNQPNK
jgi:hypothetical protein